MISEEAFRMIAKRFGLEVKDVRCYFAKDGVVDYTTRPSIKHPRQRFTEIVYYKDDENAMLISNGFVHGRLTQAHLLQDYLKSNDYV